MNRKSETKIPEFQSLDEEREYWEARGPLAEGHRGRINRAKPEKKMSSFLSIRLTGEELTRLRDMAAEFGMAPSTYARQVLKLAIEQQVLKLVMELKDPPPLLSPSFLIEPLRISSNVSALKFCKESVERAQKAYNTFFEVQKEVLEEAEKHSIGHEPTSPRSERP